MDESKARHDKDTISGKAYRLIKEKIVSGEYAAGSRLPSEPKLAESLGISRLSLREALQKLAVEGYIEKKRGAGNIVMGSQLESKRNFCKLQSLTSTLRSKGHTVGSKNVSMSYVEASENLAHKLRLEAGSKLVFIQRVRMMDDAPLSWDNYYIPETLLDEDFTPEGMGTSVYGYLEKKGIFIKSTETQIQPAMCDINLSEKLGVPEGTLLLKVIEVHYDMHNKPMFYSVEWFLNSRYEIILLRHR